MCMCLCKYICERKANATTLVFCLFTLMSLLPTAMPISARSLSSDDIISVTLFF